MEVRYLIQYAAEVVQRDIKALSPATKKRIRIAIEKKLTTQPVLFGKPLRHSLRGYRSFRIGDYRVVFMLEASKNIVKIFFIGHRSSVYSFAQSRLSTRSNDSSSFSL